MTFRIRSLVPASLLVAGALVACGGEALDLAGRDAAGDVPRPDAERADAAARLAPDAGDAVVVEDGSVDAGSPSDAGTAIDHAAADCGQDGQTCCWSEGEDGGSPYDSCGSPSLTCINYGYGGGPTCTPCGANRDPCCARLYGTRYVYTCDPGLHCNEIGYSDWTCAP